MFVVFPEFCEHTHRHTDTQTQYDYHTLPPTLRGEGNNINYILALLSIIERMVNIITAL